MRNTNFGHTIKDISRKFFPKHRYTILEILHDFDSVVCKIRLKQLSVCETIEDVCDIANYVTENLNAEIVVIHKNYSILRTLDLKTKNLESVTPKKLKELCLLKFNEKNRV